MLLTIDVGNTETVLGLYESGATMSSAAAGLVDNWRIRPAPERASAARGLNTARIPIAEDDKGGGTFNIRLGFSALPGDKPGQRVFDVKLNGKTVLKDFAIIKETGKADRALWKEFTMPISKELTLDMVAKAGNPNIAQMPLINGLQILRSE